MSKRALIVVGVLIVVVAVFVIQGRHPVNATTTGSGGCQVQVNADVLNVRSDPVDTAKIVGKLTNGNVTGATKTVQNNFRELGTGRWVSNQFVKALSGPC